MAWVVAGRPKVVWDFTVADGRLSTDLTGGRMGGWVLVTGDAVSEDEDLAEWIARADRFMSTLPPK